MAYAMSGTGTPCAAMRCPVLTFRMACYLPTPLVQTTQTDKAYPSKPLLRSARYSHTRWCL
eukprot:233924-Rhodomonas_salina.1